MGRDNGLMRCLFPAPADMASIVEPVAGKVAPAGNETTGASVNRSAPGGRERPISQYELKAGPLVPSSPPSRNRSLEPAMRRPMFFWAMDLASPGTLACAAGRCPLMRAAGRARYKRGSSRSVVDRPSIHSGVAVGAFMAGVTNSTTNISKAPGPTAPRIGRASW